VWGANVGTFLASRAARFSTQQKTAPSSVSAPSSTTASPVVPPQDAPWLQNMKATISSSTGSVKLPAKMVETPSSEQTAAAELGEETPRERSFSLNGDAQSQSHTRKDDDENIQDHDDGGNSDEEPSFGVAL
jgi:hypothetical protein